MAVDEPRVRRVLHLEAGLPHPVAPVDVLEVQEEALVHRAAAVQRRAARQKAAAQHPVHRPAAAVVEVAHQVALHRAAVGEDPAQDGPAQQQRAQRVEAAAALLQRTVLVQQLRADQPGARVRVGELEQAVERARLHDDVGVQDQVVVGAHGGQAAVAAARITRVLGVEDPAAVGEALVHGGQALVPRGVVDHDHAVADGGRIGGQRLQAPRQVVAGIVVDDDDGQPVLRGIPGRVLAAHQEILRRRSAHTIHIASRMMRRDIFEMPTWRSTNMMGISRMLSPFFQQWYVISIWNE